MYHLTSSPVTDEQLIAAFEDRTFKAGTFRHAEHVRVAFAYLKRHDLFDTIVRYRDGLKRLAAWAGFPEKYHETVTCALVVLINERMVASPHLQSWEAFAAANPDLLRWKDGAFFDYYEASVLDSPAARSTFILPRRT